MIKNLVLDIGNVICEWNPERLSASVTNNKADQEEVMKVTVQHPDWLELDRGTLTLEQAIANAQARTKLDGEIVAALYHSLAESMWIIDDTVTAMQRASTLGIPMYILSNMQHHVWAYLHRNHRCFDLCKGVVVSCEAKLIKPDPKIYQHLCERFSLEPGECIFIDDMLENVEAARNGGWHAEQLKNIGDSEAVLSNVINRIASNI